MPSLRSAASCALLALLAFPATASAITAEPRPQLGRSFTVSLVSGGVLVKTPGGGRSFRLTRRTRKIPVNSTVDATKGRVRLAGAVTRRGGRWAGVFYGGAFKATQARRARAMIDLKLVGGSSAGCAAAAAVNGVASSRRVRRLWGRARGRFRTRGSYSAATIRGTNWLTEDRCSTTVVASAEGTVNVTTGRNETEVTEGTVYESASTTDKLPIPGYADFYYAAINYDLPRGGKRRGTKGPIGDLGFRLDINLFKNSSTRPTSVDVCIRRVGSAQERCTSYPLEINEYDTDCTTPSEPDCLYGQGDQCDPESGPGDYVVRYRVNGLDIPSVFTAHLARPDPYWADVYRKPPFCLVLKQGSAVP